MDLYRIMGECFKYSNLKTPKSYIRDSGFFLCPNDYPSNFSKRKDFTQSMWRQYGECQHAYFLKYVKRMVPKRSYMPLEFGTFVHELISYYLVAEHPLYSHLDPAAYRERRVGEWKEEMWRRIDEGHTSFTEQDVVDHGLLAFELCSRWAKRDRDYQLLAISPKFRVHLKNPITGRRSPIYDYSGEYDAIVIDKHGKPWVWELKTTAMRNPEDFESLKEFDPQAWGYMYSAERILGQRTGIIYDVLRKKTPKSPRLIKCKKNACKEHPHPDCEACGGYGYIGISKSASDTTLDILQMWLRELWDRSPVARAEIESGAYEEMVEKARKNSRSFHYEIARISTSEFTDAFDRDIWEVSNEVGQKTAAYKRNKAKKFARMRGACRTITGRCSYQSVCPVTYSDAYEEYEFVPGDGPVHHSDNKVFK